MTRNAAMIDALEKLSRTRALTLAESVRLERCLRSEGLIPAPAGRFCKKGHLIAGDNARQKVIGQIVCRECDKASKRASYERQIQRVKALGNIEARGAA